MGTPLPANEPRYACGLCFGTEDDIALVQPRWIWLEFVGVQPGPNYDQIIGPQPRGKWLIEHEQDCNYAVYHPTFYLNLIWSANGTNVLWRDALGVSLFQSPTGNGKCRTRVTSGIIFDTAVYWYGGECLISWPTGGL